MKQGINFVVYFYCAFLLLGCLEDDRSSKKLKNYVKIAQLLNDYYKVEGRYPLSLLQLEHYVITKQRQPSSDSTLYDPNNILGITNPHNHKSGYGRSYTNAWDYKIAESKGDIPYIVGCDQGEIVYHPANRFQGFVLVECSELKIDTQNFFDYARVFCYQKKCTYGIYFDYDINTKSVFVDPSGLTFGAF